MDIIFMERFMKYMSVVLLMAGTRSLAIIKPGGKVTFIQNDKKWADL